MVKKHRLPSIFVAAAIVLLIGAAIVGTIWACTLYFNWQYTNDHQGCAPGQPNNLVIIKNDKVIPANTIAKRCQTLTITNHDTDQRLIAFGLHEKHVPYDGVTEQFLATGQSLTVTLVQTGSFRFHDHIHDEVQGTFSVK
jgi:hypothetical protein